MVRGIKIVENELETDNDHVGALRHIARLNYWPISSVMADKYDYTPEQAQLFASFMEPMLTVDWKTRAHAKDMLDHPWLRS